MSSKRQTIHLVYNYNPAKPRASPEYPRSAASLPPAIQTPQALLTSCTSIRPRAGIFFSDRHDDDERVARMRDTALILCRQDKRLLGLGMHMAHSVKSKTGDLGKRPS